MNDSEKLDLILDKITAMNKEMTLIEWVSLHCLGMAEYMFWAERYFCKPSKRTLLQAQKAFDKLEARWDKQMEKDLGI